MFRKIIAVVAAAVLPATAAFAYGALAIGEPPSVAQGGVAMGLTWNYKTSGEAEAAALKQCLSYMDAPDSTRALCKSVKLYHHECLSITLDPAPGTDGFGWGIAKAQADADKIAMKMCRDTDGAEHADACKVTDQHCDTMP